MNHAATVVASAAELLASADRVRQGQIPIPGMSRPRAACLLTRQAVEQVIDELLDEQQLGCRDASVRIRLICLAYAYGREPELIHRAVVAWHRLSSACHQHADELGPTLGEAETMLDEVTWLSDYETQRRHGLRLPYDTRFVGSDGVWTCLQQSGLPDHRRRSSAIDMPFAVFQKVQPLTDTPLVMAPAAADGLA